MLYFNFLMNQNGHRTTVIFVFYISLLFLSTVDGEQIHFKFQAGRLNQNSVKVTPYKLLK